MGRSIRNKPKNVGGGTVSDAQLQTKADATTVSALQTTVDALSVVEANPTASGTTDLTRLKVGSTTYDIPTDTRNYQYVQQTSRYITTVNALNTWFDISGLDGTDALQITTLKNDTQVRLHLSMRGNATYSSEKIQYQIKRSVNGVNTSLNVPTGVYPGTLSSVEIVASNHTDDGVIHHYEMYFIDDLQGIGEGQTITYVPQLQSRFSGSFSFYLNMTTGDSKSSMVSGNEKYHERSLSIFEAEEILTGPPLTINSNVVPINPTNGHFIQWNGSAYTTAFPQFPYIKVSQTTDSSHFTSDGFHFMPFDTVEQSSHNIFSTTNYYHIDVPAGVYLIILNVGYQIVQTDGALNGTYPYLSAIIERGTNGDFVYDTGPMNLPNVSSGRQVTTPSVVTSLSSAGTIRFQVYLYRMNIDFYHYGGRSNQAYIIKIG